MKILRQSEKGYSEFAQTLERRALPDSDLRELVADLIARVKDEGDKALAELAARLDNVTLTPERFRVAESELDAAAEQVSQATREAIEATKQNIHAFAARSLRQDWEMRNTQGARVGEKFLPYERVGVYVPGGKAPLVSTALMTAAFAKAAGVKEIVAATPCSPEREVNAALLYALKEAGATEILKLGGVQGIAALALGTETIRPVEKIVGPGNKYVVEAKRQLVGAVSIDLLPGPSEILTIADDSAKPSFIAADLLAQAEHGTDSLVGFITPSASLLEAVQSELALQADKLQRRDTINQSMQKAFALLVDNLDEAARLCNAFAPEHLSLIVKNPDYVLELVKNAGAIYLGNYSPVAAGDFLAGPSHTLPTGGAARSFSGLRADQFQRRISIVELDPASLEASLPHILEFSRIEGLDAHGASAAKRLERTQ